MLIINKNVLKLVIRLLLTLVFLVIAGLTGLYIYNRPLKLEVDFLDVGQGDAALIKTPGGQVILIDGGPDNLVLRRLGENLPFYRRRIDFLILSHHHDDHASGLVEVLKRYKVGKIIYTGAYDLPALKIMAGEIKKQGLAVYSPDSAAHLNLKGNCVLDFLNPLALGVSADDNNSLIVKLECQNKKFLFTGDNSLKVEKALINSGWDLSADIFKAAHHGSNSANSEDFLQAINPKQIIVSVGAENRFGHPSSKFIERAAKLGFSVLRTDILKTIKIFSQY